MFALIFGKDDSRFNGALTFFVVTFCDVRTVDRFNDDESIEDRDVGFSIFVVVVVVVVVGSDVFFGIFFCLSNGSDDDGIDEEGGGGGTGGDTGDLPTGFELPSSFIEVFFATVRELEFVLIFVGEEFVSFFFVSVEDFIS